MHWKDRLLQVGLVLTFIGAVALVAYATLEEARDRRVFREACLQDHKEYECEAMLRAMERHVVILPQ